MSAIPKPGFEERPDPLVPAACDLSDFDWFPFFHKRLRGSAFWKRASDTARAVSVDLWCEAFAQVPAGSLPDDDYQLSDWAGFGRRDLSQWMAVKAEVMGAWTLCSDGRWYHPTLCEVAIESWLEHQTRAQEVSTPAARKRRERIERSRMFSALRERGIVPAWNIKTSELRETFQKECSATVTPISSHASRNQSQQERDQSQNVTAITETVTDTGIPEADASGALDPDLDARAWSEAVALIRKGGDSEKSARSFFGKLLSLNGLRARDLLPSIASATVNATGDPKAYLTKAAKNVGTRRSSGPVDQADWI